MIQLMYIDDDIEDIEVFLEAVAACDHSINCRIAKDGEEAIESLLSHPNNLPQLIFLDVNMPRMGGRECLRILKTNHVTAEIPVIIYSTTNDPAEIASLKSLGAERCVGKHSTFTALCDELNQTVNQLALRF